MTTIDFTKVATLLAQNLPSQTSLTNTISQAGSLPIIGSAISELSSVSTIFSQFTEAEQKLAALGTSVTEDATLRTDVQNAVYSVFGSGQSPLTLGDLNNDGKVDATDITVTENVGGDGGISVEMLLQSSQTTTAATNFNLGLNNLLTLSTTGSVSLSASIDYLFQFTFDPSSSSLSIDPTNLATALTVPNIPVPTTPFAVILNATPSPDFSANGVLAGLLQASITNNGSQFSGAIGVGFDSSGEATAELTATAHVGLGLDLSFLGGRALTSYASINPELKTGFSFDWTFSDQALGSIDLSTAGSISQIQFSAVDVTLDLGIVGQILGDIQDFTKPLEPLVDFLTTQIPGLTALGIKVTILQLLTTLVEEPQLDQPITDILSVISDFNSFDASVSGTVTIPVLNGFAIADPRQAAGLSYITGSADTTIDSEADQMINNALDSSDGGDPIAAGSQDQSYALDAATADDGAASSTHLLAFPIVDDPIGTLIPLLLGNRDVNLITFTLPTLQIPVKETQFVIAPIIPGLVDLFIDIKLQMSVGLKFGYDSAGLFQLAQDLASGSATDETINNDLLHGFWTTTDGTTGISLTGSVDVGAAAVIVSVQGGLSATISATPSQSLDNDPDDVSAHKVRLDDVINQINSSNDSIFAAFGDSVGVSGSVGVNFSVNIGIELGFVHITLFSLGVGPITVFSFSAQNSPPATPPPSSIHTIYVQESNQNEKISVTNAYEPVDYQLPLLLQKPTNMYEKGIMVSGPDSSEFYPFALETANPDKTYTFVSNLMDSDGNPIRYNLISVVPDPNSTYQQTIDVSDIVGDSMNDPVNAVLIGGGGDNELEYHGPGEAVLIGGSNRKNTLVVDDPKAIAYEYGDLIDPEVPSPLNPSTPDPSSFYGSLPPNVQSEIAEYIGTNPDALPTTDPSSPQTADKFSAPGNDDFLEGGPGTNTFSDFEGDVTIVGEGSVTNAYQINPSRDPSAGQNVQITSGPGYNNLSVGLSGKSVNIAAVSGQLRVTGVNTSITTSGVFQAVGINLDNQSLEVGDLSTMPQVDYDGNMVGIQVFVGDSGGANTVTLDASAQDVPGDVTVHGTFRNVYESIGGSTTFTEQRVADLTDPPTGASVEFTNVTSSDTVIIKLNGGSVTFDSFGYVGPETFIVDGTGRGEASAGLANTVSLEAISPSTAPYQNEPGFDLNVGTTAAGDPYFQSLGGIDGPVVIAGSQPVDQTLFTIPFQVDAYGMPVAPNVLDIDASALEGALDLDVVNPPYDLSQAHNGGYGYLQNNLGDMLVAINAVNPQLALTVNGLNLAKFPAPLLPYNQDFQGQAEVTVGAGLLSKIQGQVTLHNAQVTVDNSLATVSEVLSLSSTNLSGWAVPTSGVTPTLTLDASGVYFAFALKAGKGDQFNVTGTPQVVQFTPVAPIYGNPPYYETATILNSATSATPDVVAITGDSAITPLDLVGNFAVALGQGLNSDGSTNDIGLVDSLLGSINLDYTGSGTTNVVYNPSHDTSEIEGTLQDNGSGTMKLSTGLNGGAPSTLVFPSANVAITIDGGDAPEDAKNTFDISSDDADPVTFQATAGSLGSTPVDRVFIDSNQSDVTIQGNTATLVYLYSSYNVYQGDITVNNADQLYVGYYNNPALNTGLAAAPVLTSTTLTQFTLGLLRFAGLGSFYVSAPPTTSLIINDTPAGASTYVESASVTVAGTNGTLYVNSPKVTVGNGVLASILGNVYLANVPVPDGTLGGGQGTETIDDHLDVSQANVELTGGAITGLSPATISYSGDQTVDILGAAGSTYAIAGTNGSPGLYVGEGSTANVSGGDATILGAAQVFVTAGSAQVLADPARPNDMTVLTVTSTGLLVLDNEEPVGLPTGLSRVAGVGSDGTSSDVYYAGATTSLVVYASGMVDVSETSAISTTINGPPNVTVYGTGTNSVVINTASGTTYSSEVDIQSTAGPVTVNEATSVYTVIGQNNSVQTIEGRVDVIAASGSAPLSIDDSADTTGRGISSTPIDGGDVQLAGLAPAPIAYSPTTFDPAPLRLDNGGNSVTITDTTAGNPVTFQGGTGADSFQVFVSGNGAYTPLTIDGNGQTTSLAVSGSGDSPTIANFPSQGFIDAFYSSGTTREIDYSNIAQFNGISYTSASTTTAVNASTTSVNLGQSFTVTVSVTANSSGLPAPTGLVQLDDNGIVSTASLQDGSATLSVGPETVAGAHAITVNYLGDNFNQASEGTTSVYVNGLPKTRLR